MIPFNTHLSLVRKVRDDRVIVELFIQVEHLSGMHIPLF